MDINEIKENISKGEKKDKRTLCGIAFVFFGFLLLLRELGVLSEDNFLLNPKCFPFYLAAIFLYGRELKVASLFGIIGLVVCFPDIATYIGKFANFIWPLLLIGIGALLIYTVKKNKRPISGKTSANEKKDDVETVEAEEVE